MHPMSAKFSSNEVEAKGMKTRTQALAEIRARGQTVVGWARANNVRPDAVRAVLYGTNKGLWGEAHRASVLLGLKEGESASKVK